MKIIAITGGIGSGKSTIRQLFEDEGAHGIDADQLARKAVEPGSEGARKVAEAFGAGFFDKDGRLDRKRMASLVFADDKARRKLEAILHPIIRDLERKEAKSAFRGRPGTVVVVEIPLLAEGGRAAKYDAVVNVVVPADTRLRRLAASGRYSEEEARARIDSQAVDATRSQVADYTIDNSGSLEETRRQVKKIISHIFSTISD